MRHVQRVTAKEEDNTPEGNEGNLDEQSGEIDETDLDTKMTKMKIENERSVGDFVKYLELVFK